jgi:hypothetical protein
MAAKTAGTWVALEPIGVGDLTTVGTTKLWPLGTKCKARDVGATAYGEGEFVYLAGVTSTARGSVVTITDTWGTALIAARATGAVAVALAAVDASTKFGWYQVRGQGVALCDTVAANLPCYIDGTSGRIDDAAVAGDQVIGMRTVSTDDTNTCVVHMAINPSVADFDNA